MERYQDDGLVRWSAFPAAGRADCCVVERYNLAEDRLSYRLLACAGDAAARIDCAGFQGNSRSGDGFVFGGTDMPVDRTWPGSIDNLGAGGGP